MLTRLYVKNFALVREATLEFSPELNCLTGETGAGKSILIDAIRFVLGERMEIPAAAGETCIVEAVFELRNLGKRGQAGNIACPLFDEVLAPFLEPEEDVLILRKESSDARTRVLINNRAANNSSLKEIGRLLLDIHGQYDHQLLLDSASHLDLIDRFAKTAPLLAEYQTLYQEYDTLRKRQEELKALAEGRERELDLLKYQVEEIERAGLREREEEELKTEHLRFGNSEKLHELASRMLAYLEEEERSVSDLLGQACREMNALVKLDPSLEESKAGFENVQLEFEERSRSLREYRENLSFDPERLAEIEKRLDLIEHLKRKYGRGVISAVLEFFEKTKKKYDELLNGELYEKDAEKKIRQLWPKLESLAEELREKRKKAASVLKRTIETELKDLELSHTRFDCEIQKQDFSQTGADALEFMISLNPGEPLLPLRKIVSAGEVSRIMLAMKKALMKVDPVLTLIFDEIDANIGGRLGEVTGQKLKEIASERQVLLITHLPQIASFADRHFKVSKTVKTGKTSTEYRIIAGEERVQELAQMMSGKNETEISRKHAKEMLNKVGK